MAAGVALHDNFNPIEDLMKVNNKQPDNQTVFEEYRQKYFKHFAANDKLIEEKQYIHQKI